MKKLINSIDPITLYSESQFPLGTFAFIPGDEKIIATLESNLRKVIPQVLDSIIIQDNWIQVRTAWQPHDKETVYLDEFTIIKEIIHTLSGFDQDIVGYQLINVNSEHQNIITVILNYILP